jgi:hypothetical protein
MLYTAGAAAIALSTLGLTGAVAPATAATGSSGGTICTNWGAGYQVQGRWLRFVSATVTVTPRRIPNPHSDSNGDAQLALIAASTSSYITVVPGGGANSVSWEQSYGGGMGSFSLQPKVGDQLNLSIYYDRQGHTQFTATDITQGITRTAQVTVGNLVYTKAFVVGLAYGPELLSPPPKDIELWHFTASHVTSYTGVHGTLLGPWQTDKVIDTTNGNSMGSDVLSPSALWQQGQGFRVFWRHG